MGARLRLIRQDGGSTVASGDPRRRAL